METQTPPKLTWKLRPERPPGEWVTLHLEFYLDGVWLLNYQDKFHAVECIDMTPPKAQTLAGCVWDRMLSMGGYLFAVPFKDAIIASLATTIGQGLPRPPPLPPIRDRYKDPPPRPPEGGAGDFSGVLVPFAVCTVCLAIGFVVGMWVGISQP